MSHRFGRNKYSLRFYAVIVAAAIIGTIIAQLIAGDVLHAAGFAMIIAFVIGIFFPDWLYRSDVDGM